ncbi:retrovirus-related pol polyprotein from transposon TNT 1-94 [Tanacetum coccineum]
MLVNRLHPRLSISARVLKSLEASSYASSNLALMPEWIVMLIARTRLDLNVIDENDDKLIQVWLTYAVHKVHEYRRSIGQPKENPQLVRTREPIWYLDSGCSRSMTGVKSYLQKYVEQPCPKNRSIIVKRHDETPYEIFRERVPDISYFHMFGCLVFIHNRKDRLGKFDAKVDDGYFLGYSFVSKDFKVFKTRRQQIEETYHATFDKSMKAIRIKNTSVDEIGIDNSSRYPPDEFLQEDDPSRQYQANSDISYYITLYGHSLIELTQDNYVREVITINEKNTPYNKDVEVPQYLIIHHASTSLHPAPQDRWSRDQHIELLNIIGEPTKGMLTRCMVANLTDVSTSECLFADFLSKIEPKKISEALKHLGNKKGELRTVFGNKARLVFRDSVKKKELTMMKPLHHAFPSRKLKDEPTSFESCEFLDYVCKLEKISIWIETSTQSMVLHPLVCGIQSAQDLILKDTQTQTMLVAIWTEKAPQVPVKFLEASWSVGVQRNNS